MSERFHTIAADGISLTLDLAVGHIRSLEIERDGRRIAPLHTAPWVDDPAIAADPDIAANLKYLSGDFFCAPFGSSDVEEAPPHGWPPNAPWTFAGEEKDGPRRTRRFTLERKVMGARLTKEITLQDGHPFVYQCHIFEGGKNGAVSVASHAMTRFHGKGRLSFSPKAFAELPSAVQEGDPTRGRSLFAHPAHFTDLTRLPLADGTTADLHDHPIAEGHEDFAMLVEEKGARLGWAAAVRPDAGDVMLSLKNPADFPVTFLWFSNGGRYYPPWNSRHLGVLGIEEGRAYSSYGHAASIAPNPLSEAGIPTSLTLSPDGSVSVRHVIGGLPLPAGWSEVAGIDARPGALRMTASDGSTMDCPFDDGFLGAPG
jgi:predicted metal-dependent enzyme (double-stranded beta helix superfamily)